MSHTSKANDLHAAHPGKPIAPIPVLKSILLAALVLLLPAFAPVHAQTAGLVASYSFEEGTGTAAADSSGANNNGTINGATWTTSGKYGKALSFDGVNDILTVAHNSSLNLTSAMTLEAWVYPTTLGGYRTVLMKEVSNELSYTLYASGDVNVPSGWVRIGSTSRNINAPSALPLNTWTHIAATYGGGNLRFYVNGVQVATQARTGNIATSTRPLFIGGNQVWGEFFAGRIDEVKVYNRVLTAAEIAADMAGGATTPRLNITSPANNATITGTTVNVAFNTTGDTSAASYVALRVDSGATQLVPLASPAQLTGLSYGTHTLNGWLARADQSKITDSDATAITFTTQPVPAPKLTFTAPTAGSTVVGSTVTVNFTTSGDLSEADHVHLSLDGGPDLMVMSLSGSLQLDEVALGSHTIAGYVVRADHSKIASSDATPVTFTTVATPPPPVLSITSPTNNATIMSSTATIAFNTTGDTSNGAHHVHFSVDGGPDREASGLTGTHQVTSLTPGAHTVRGFVVRADHSKVSGSDSPTINFTVQITDPNDPAVVGRWDSIIQLPTVAVDLALLHTGKAIFWAGDFSSAPNYGELWNPANNAITPVPNPFSNIFCSSHVHLADGRLLVAGGHDAAAGIMGIADSNTFDPITETWTSLPDMAFRRWYPTLTMLGDGRAIIISGSENSESVFVQIPEIYDPVTNTWTRLNNAAMSIPQYPMVYLLPDGRLLQSGTTEQPTLTRVLNVATQQWTTIDAQVIEGGSGVMYAPGKIMKSGSASNDGATPNAASLATTYVLDMNQPNPSWRQTAPMAYPRTFHNLTSLADGSVIATSGSRRKSETDLSAAVFQAELWSPATETWTTLLPQQAGRIYHSTAVLLPDARVAVSGSGNISGATDQTSLEIFSPPYLFKGPRPTITSAPDTVKYGTTFFVATPDGANIKAVNLLRPGAATHNFDQDQRFVPVTFTVVSGGIQVTAPAHSNLAPPGHYMLFLISNAGVPSVSKFVRFPAAYEDSEPPSAPGNLQGTGGVGSSSLSWLPSADNVGVVRYEIYRSTSAVFTPSAANLVGQTTGTSFTDTGLAAGTYYYIVLAVDAVGGKSAASNTAQVAATADTLPPSVELTGLANGATVSGFVALTAIAADNVAVASVTFRVDGVAVGTEDTSSPYSLSWNTSGISNGPHTITAVARDASNNTTVSAAIAVTVSNTGPQAPAGLVAAWSFSEGSGTTTADTSGGTNVGTLSGATWTAQGKFGGALSFDGVNDTVTVADANVLDLTNAMTLSAWVFPTAQNSWATVMMKEGASSTLAYALYSSENVARPSGWIRTGSQDRTAAGSGALPLNTWTHLAMTYDGANLRVYVNGAQVATQSVTGSVGVSALPLRIGGNSVWGEYFTGRIDEAHVYNRALTVTEIAADMQVGGAPAVPKLNITSPTNGASINGASINVSFSTTGDAGQASFAALRVDSGAIAFAPLGGGPVQIPGLTPGVHSLNGWLARSDQSRIDGSDANTISFTMVAVDNTPKLSITSPAPGSNVSGTTVNVSFSTSGDLTNAHHVYIRLDGGPDLMVQALSGQVQIEEVAGGAHTLNGYVARADNSKITGSDATAVPFTTTVPDTTKPVVVIVSPMDGSTVSNNVTLTATATDNVGVAGVQFKLNGVALGAEDTAAPYSYTWNTTTAANGAHVVTATARDAAGNTTTSIAINVVVLNATGAVLPGLVAAYGFEAGSGTSAADSSGQNNAGTLSGATWTTAGKFGNALSFDGNDMVNIPDAASLDLTNGMTLSAWVYPTAQSPWGTVILKEATNNLAYALYARESAATAAGYVRIGSSDRRAGSASALALNTWTHIASTYDGANLRFYVNGVQTGTLAVTGNMSATTLPLRIGGNTIWGEYFTGRIDEVRVFNRALNATELQSMMNAPVVGAGASQPTRSTSIAVDSAARHVWVVNPDSDTVTRINADTLAVQMEIPVGKRPTSVAVDGANQVWVTCRDDDTIWVLSSATGGVVNTFPMRWGSAPVSVVLTPDRSAGYIAFRGTGQIQRFTPSTRAFGPILSLGTTPQALAITGDAKKLLVTQFISTGTSGTVRTIDLTTFAAAASVQLPIDTTSVDGSLAGRGLPNYLAGVAADPANGIAWVVAKKDNIVRGLRRDAQPLTFETTVRAIVSRIDLNQNQEQTNRRLDLDNASSPSAVALSESGALAFITLQGNNRLIVLNQIGGEIIRGTTGLAPEGVAIDPVTKRVFTQDLMSRSVSVFDGAPLINNGQPQLAKLAQLPTVQVEKMSAMALRGKQVFYNAEDPRMSRDGYLSCASCHVNGEMDGQTWDFSDRGEGFRNTPSLLGKGGTMGSRLHWTGNFDEVQDFENDIRAFFGGTGFMSDAEFGLSQDPLGPLKGGRSEDLDALAQYLDALKSAGRSPYRDTNGAMTSGAVAGQTIFNTLNCQQCHSGPHFSDSYSGARHDVGTLKATSGSRIGQPIDGLDTPTLRGLWNTAPYLHDGSAATLKDVLTTANPGGAHGNVLSLTPAQIDQVVEYLNQIDGAVGQ